MKKTELNKDYLDENTFWHITSRLNIESITQHGLVPRDGKRDGESKSAEDPVPRVFFSQGLEGVLGQANNLAFLINCWIDDIKKTSIGDSGKDIKKKMQDFIDNSTNDKIEIRETKNGGFIDIANFIREDVFKNGIDENLTEQDLDKIIYDIVKTIWENDVCLKANLKESVDYSWDDVNYNAKGTRKVPMTKKNMHAFEGRTIATDIIEIITDENGKPRTTWDVFKEMAMFYKKEHPDKKWLPVEEWQSGYEDENGQIIYSGEINHRKDYLSMFMEIERLEQLHDIKFTQDLGRETLEEQKDTRTESEFEINEFGEIIRPSRTQTGEEQAKGQAIEQEIGIGEVKKGIWNSKIATREKQSQEIDIKSQNRSRAIFNRSRKGGLSQEEQRLLEENERQRNQAIVDYRNEQDNRSQKRKGNGLEM